MTRLRRWWQRRTKRQRAWLVWGLPLLAAAVAVQLDWFYRHAQGVATPQTGRSLILRVGWVLTFAVLIKLVFTRKWSVQDIGIVLALAGVAGLFVRIIGRWGPQPTGEAERDGIQALLDIGAVTLAIGLVVWTVLRILGREDDAGEAADSNIVYDRRKGPGRRAGDRR